MRYAKRWSALLVAVLIACAATAAGGLAEGATPAPAPDGIAAPDGADSPDGTSAPDDTAPDPTDAATPAAAATPAPTGRLATGGPIDVRFVSAYQRAEQSGMYVEVKLKGDAYDRVRRRLRTMIDDASQRLSGEQANAAAEEVIKSFLAATRRSLAMFYQVARGSADSEGAVVQIEEGYVKAYDFIAISDAQGREMLYPVMEYDVDLYGQLIDDARPKLSGLALDLIRRSFGSVTGAMDGGTARDALTVQFDRQIAGFALTDEEVAPVFEAAAAAQMGEGITLRDAVDASSDLTIGGLGEAVPVRVAEGDAARFAAYELTPTEDGGGLAGEPLAAVLSIDQIMSDTAQGSRLYLNAAGELVYLKPLQGWLSADAAKLTALLAERGGQTAAAPSPEQPTFRVNPVLWYVLGGVALLAAALAAVYLILKMRIRGNRRR
ncbi:MAG: hypothetical protein GX558_04005 [Clostridiales bacterium]|nr:hypothetical protein [Clostridiales bacterium]